MLFNVDLIGSFTAPMRKQQLTEGCQPKVLPWCLQIKGLEVEWCWGREETRKR
jgi:hypothetical protein